MEYLDEEESNCPTTPFLLMITMAGMVISIRRQEVKYEEWRYGNGTFWLLSCQH
jgi:hypothetical protein